ncbi:MAG: type II secretion system protein E [Gammaproteobacteria bacterium RBG_16_51_14]|nr:MAG: type II secretion system protein E [Gammaproteobacteria bacterium RBG_16_51_14]
MQKTIITQPSEERLTLSYVLVQLQKDGIISPQQAAQLANRSQDINKPSIHPLLLVSEQGWQSATQPPYHLTLETLTRWLAEKTGQAYLRLDPLKIDVRSITGIVSQGYAARLKILPVTVNEKELTVATCEPFIESWEEELAHIAGRKIKRVIINPRDLERYLVEFYGVSRSILGAINEKADEPMALIQNFEQLVQVGKAGEPDANDRHIVSIVDWLLQFAFEQRASDIHLEPRRGKGRVRFRIDGVLHIVHEFPSVLMGAITSRLKSLGRMDVTDRRRPQDGRVKTVTPSGKEVEMRLSTMPTTFGEKLVMRIFDPEMLVKSFKDLGFTRHDEQCLKDIMENPHGIILVTGPTGSGKTTTLYSVLNHLARPELNICTIEDPIEMVDPLFNQMQVQPAIGVDFASGVRTLLRQDPDIIMVGEIRDKETADVAIQAALTGHLVLSSLHTNDASAAVTRLIDIGSQPFLINATLLGVVAQRLIRTLCNHCKQADTLDKEAWNHFAAPHRLRPPKKVYTSKGCDECRHTGYMGRVAIYEILTVNSEIRKQITATTSLDDLHAAAIAQGMRSLRIGAAQKIAEGVTTLEEAYSVLPQRSE